MLHALSLLGLVAEGMTGALAAGPAADGSVRRGDHRLGDGHRGGTIRDVLGHYPCSGWEHPEYVLLVAGRPWRGHLGP